MENQRPPTDQSGGFVMEEDMLESDEKQVPGLFQNASADPTSRLVKTNDVRGNLGWGIFVHSQMCT